MERTRLLEPPVGRLRAPAGVSALCFDAHQEIMWVGRHDGWVSSYEVRFNHVESVESLQRREPMRTQS